MSIRNGPTDRRKYMRLKAKEGAFAVLVSDHSRIGQIKDISQGGLTFQYIDKGGPANISSEIELFSTVCDFHLKKLQVKSVVDFKVDRTVPFSSLPMRQLRIEFGEMTHAQLKQLDHFLQNYTQK